MKSHKIIHACKSPHSKLVDKSAMKYLIEKWVPDFMATLRK